MRKGKIFSIHYPEKAREWHPTKNGDLRPNDVTVGYNKKVWWICEKGHEWEYEVANRTKKNRKSPCPYCKGILVCPENNLFAKFPALCREWNNDMNNGIYPQDISWNSTKKVWWKCKFGHEWESRVSDRSKRGDKCPYCSGRRACVDNCLETLRPDLAKEWVYEKNDGLTPKDVTVNSKKTVWWKCKEGHNWKTTILNRNKGNNCSVCSEPKGEKRIKEFFHLKNIKFEPQKSFDDLTGLGGGKLSFDFYLPHYNLLIEYQGEQHEKPIDFFNKSANSAEELFIRQREHDRRKLEYSKLKGIRLLQIWHWDYDKVELILNEELQKSSN